MFFFSSNFSSISLLLKALVLPKKTPLAYLGRSGGLYEHWGGRSSGWGRFTWLGLRAKSYLPELHLVFLEPFGSKYAEKSNWHQLTKYCKIFGKGTLTTGLFPFSFFLFTRDVVKERLKPEAFINPGGSSAEENPGRSFWPSRWLRM